MTSYAILEDSSSLNRLCFRAGYRLEGVSFNSILSGEEIIEKLKTELGVEEQDLHLDISIDKKYRFCQLTVSQMSRIKSWVGGLFKEFIGGTLLLPLK